jgi:Cu(I)/Ag(I) efflux system membrane fusion protein
VWILADVYDSLQPFIHPGLDALVTTASQHRRFNAKVSAAQPIFDETTRTVKVRLESDNSGLVLKPGMFVDVEFAIDVTPTLTVPVDAVVDTGLRKTVFVDRGSGHFQPRQIETGWRMDGDVEVVKGLMEGERIVVSGTFLIDSETRMRAARLETGRDPVKDPVCGMDLDPDEAAAAGRRVEDRGETYYFCSDECKRRFLADPGKFALK